MPKLADLIAYCTSVIIMAATPGPSWMTTLAAARCRQFGAVAKCIAGVAFANILLIVGASLLKYIGIVLPVAVRDAVALIGSAGLVMLALQMFLKQRPLRFGPSVPLTHPTAPARPFVSSALMHLLNPNSLVFYISIFLSIVHVNSNYWDQVLLVGGFAVLVDLLFMSFAAGIGTFLAFAWPPEAALYAGRAAAVCFAFLGTRAALRILGLQ